MTPRWIRAAAVVSLALSACGGLDDVRRPESPASDPVGEAHRDRVEATSRALRSDDWEERHETLRRLRAFGAAANDVVLPALKDRCEVVRKAAQHHFIDLGETAVPYLVQTLIDTESDEGFFARIAGGKERHEIKSVAGTLWLTLVRGVPRDRRLEITRDLIASDSAKIRAVGLFTATSMSDATYLGLLESIAGDPDPMLRERLWESLTLLLAKRTGSAPDLDAAASEATLTLLGPELIPMLNSEKPGAVDRWQTFGAALGRARVHADVKPRFVRMLQDALDDDRLSSDGAVWAGAILAGQYDADERASVFRRRVARLDETEDEATARQLAVLSAFPPSAYDLSAASALLAVADRLAAPNGVAARGLPMLAAGFLKRARSEADPETAHRAMASLARWIEHRDPAFAFGAAIAHSRVLEEIERALAAEKEGDEEARAASERLQSELVASAGRQADALFARAGSLRLDELYELLKLFVLIDDARYLDLFDQLWSHRWDDVPGIANVTARPIALLSRRQDRAILDRVLACAEAPEGRWHSSVRDLCAYVLSRRTRYGAFVDEFLTEERFERWVRIIEDPDLHPRTRSCFLAMVESEGLDPRMRSVLADLALKYSAAPNDSNLRAKALLSLGTAGDRRALAPIYAMALEPDHPSWIWQNLTIALGKLLRPPPDPSAVADADEPVAREVVQVMVDLLDAQLTTMRRPDGVRFAYSNNYYWWGIEYLYFAPEHTAGYLEEITGEELGLDVAAWRDWLARDADDR